MLHFSELVHVTLINNFILSEKMVNFTTFSDQNEHNFAYSFINRNI